MPILSESQPTYEQLRDLCNEYGATLLAVSKTRSEKEIMNLYKKGQRTFGENRAHELIIKASLLPSDIEWHLIGHLQTNKANSVVKFAHCIQSLDSLKLWQKLDEEAKAEEVHVKCLLQIKIATEDTKYGWSMDELESVLQSGNSQKLSNVTIEGVMGMATLTSDNDQVRHEFRSLKKYFDQLKAKYFSDDRSFKTISMGMSGDYHIALEEGSTMLRIGSLLFN